jgi:hypothetical protein
MRWPANGRRSDWPLPALVVLGVLLASPAAQAEVVRASADGFTLSIAFDTPAPPARAFAALGEIGAWWSSEHTYSGDAANMTLDLTAGGCFCERWDGGSITHATVVQVRNDAVLRLTGGLGPLQELPVSQVHDWTVEAAAEGSRVTYATRVAGAPGDNLGELAPLVDMVMAEQMERLRAYLADKAQ